MKKIDDLDTLQQLYSEDKNFLLFKNSTTCPISAEAFSETEKFAAETNFPVYYLNVQELREGSNDVAAHFGIKHESPQAFLLSNKEVKWHDSHGRITKKSLEEAAAKLS